MGYRTPTPLAGGSALGLTVLAVIVIVVVGAAGLRAQTPYELGLDAYRRGDFDAAVTHLAASAKTAPSAAAYHDLALAHYRLGDTGAAIWAAASAEALGTVPGADTLARALAQRIPLELRPLPPDSISSAWRQVALAAPGNLAAVAGLVLVLLACGLVAARLLGAGRGGTVPGLVAAGAGLLAVVALGLAFTKARAQTGGGEVVTLEPTTLYAAPSVRSEEIRGLPAGTRLPVSETLGDTYLVTLPTGANGWVAIGATRRVLSKD